MASAKICATMRVTSIEKNAAGLILCFVWRHLIFIDVARQLKQRKAKRVYYNMVFTVDNTPPTIDKTAKMAEFTERRSEDGELLLNSQDFADIKEKGYDALWSVNDTSVFKASVKLDGIDFVDFSDLTAGYHTMTISVTDEVGHVTTETFDFTYDGTAPRIIITGVDGSL